MASKETQSPKVKHRKPGRGIHEGDKVVKRQKRKTAIGRVGLGDDLMSQVKSDRTGQTAIKAIAHQAAKRKPFVRNTALASQLVSERVGHQVASLANRAGWCPEARSMVRDYIKSLTTGSGDKPANLGTQLSRIVEHLFDDACRELRIAWDILPGQRTERYLNRTAKYRKPREQLASAS